MSTDSSTTLVREFREGQTQELGQRKNGGRGQHGGRRKNAGRPRGTRTASQRQRDYLQRKRERQANAIADGNSDNTPYNFINKGSKNKWRDGNTTVFLDLWEDSLEELRGPGKKIDTYIKMAEQLRNIGIIVTDKEVKRKLHSMSRKYRDEKQNIGPSGGTPSRWEHYNRVHRIIGGHKPFHLSEAMVESTDLYQLLSENSAETSNSFFVPVESGSHPPTGCPSRKVKNKQDDERESRRRMIQLTEERNTAILQILGATLRMEEDMNRFLLGCQRQTNNVQ